MKLTRLQKEAVQELGNTTLEELLAWAKEHPMTPEEAEEQRRDFAHWNAKLSNPNVTREMVDRAAERLKEEE